MQQTYNTTRNHTSEYSGQVYMENTGLFWEMTNARNCSQILTLMFQTLEWEKTDKMNGRVFKNALFTMILNAPHSHLTLQCSSTLTQSWLLNTPWPSSHKTQHSHLQTTIQHGNLLYMNLLYVWFYYNIKAPILVTHVHSVVEYYLRYTL